MESEAYLDSMRASSGSAGASPEAGAGALTSAAGATDSGLQHEKRGISVMAPNGTTCEPNSAASAVRLSPTRRRDGWRSKLAEGRKNLNSYVEATGALAEGAAMLGRLVGQIGRIWARARGGAGFF